jgi:GNAT superfamily N-acetyltransferase
MSNTKGPKDIPMSLTVRPAVPDDVPVLFDMINEAYKVEIGDTGVAFKTGDRFDSQSEINPVEYIVLTDSVSADEIVGCARVIMIDGDGPCFLSGARRPYAPGIEEQSRIFSRGDVPTAMFGPFVIAKKRQGTGLASTLITHVEDRARALGARSMEIGVINWRTDVQPFYMKRGYSFVYEVPYMKPSFLRDTSMRIYRKPLT